MTYRKVFLYKKYHVEIYILSYYALQNHYPFYRLEINASFLPYLKDKDKQTNTVLRASLYHAFMILSAQTDIMHKVSDKFPYILSSLDIELNERRYHVASHAKFCCHIT